MNRRGLACAILLAVVIAINAAPGVRVAQDQPEYYFQYQVIRNEKTLNAIRDYIAQNPVQWADEPDNPDCSQE